MARLEEEAQAKAAKHVANMLARPDQLEKVGQLTWRVSRKKASVEAMLKTAMQSQVCRWSSLVVVVELRHPRQGAPEVAVHPVGGGGGGGSAPWWWWRCTLLVVVVVVGGGGVYLGP